MQYREKSIDEVFGIKGIERIEAECCPDHIHMLLRIPPKYSVAKIMGYLKGKSELIIFDRHANVKYKYGNQNFGAEDITWIQLERMQKEYIQKQLQEDMVANQISLKEYINPFVKKGK